MDTQVECITEEVMLALADNMAAAAASFSAHGYDQFILARDVFISTNHTLFASRPPVSCTLGGNA